MTLISTLGQALDQIERIKQQQSLLGDIQLQVASGKKTQRFTGLGADTIISERARADFNELDTFLDNITRGETRTAQMVSSLDEIQNQAQNVLNALAGQPQQGDIDLSTIKQISTTAFDFVIDLLNTQDGDTYLFAGGDSSIPPINNTGSLDAFFASLNPLWTAGTLPFTPPDNIADAYTSQYRNIPEVTAGFSGSLNSAKNVLIRVDESVEVDYTTLANNPALRDIIMALGTINNIPDVINAPGAMPIPGVASPEQKDNFFQVFNDLAVMLSDAIDDVDQLKFRLNSVQVTLNQTKELHKFDKSVLLGTIDSVENVDLAEAATKLNFLQIQLEASFRVSAAVRDLSLVNFL